jgi:transposase
MVPSSKTCSGCQAVKPKLPLRVRTYLCDSCGLLADRDENAALIATTVGWDAALIDAPVLSCLV